MMAGLSNHERAAIGELYRLIGPVRLRHCPVTPTPQQEAFLRLDDFEVFYGGAAAGGKSVAMLMAAAQYLDVPGYDALVLRPTLIELQLPGGLIALSHDWFARTKAQWIGELKQWRFPGPSRSGSGGGTLSFGYFADPGDFARYQGTSLSFLGFDELTSFPELSYRRMFRALRQPTALTQGMPARDGTRLKDVPVRVRSTSNPGGPHHEWVRMRFVDPETREPGAIFLPSRTADNPHIDPDAYARRLEHLPGAERARLVDGDWNIPDDGSLFQRDWFPIIEEHQLPSCTRAVRYWDLAGSEPSTAHPDPDWTVGLRLDYGRDKVFYVKDMVRVRKSPATVERIVAETANTDGYEVEVRIEEEGGASGKSVSARYKRDILPGYSVHSDRPNRSKELRAHPVAAAAENGLIKVVRGPHTRAFLDELVSFPNGRHDDCVDALAAAHHHLARQAQSRGMRTYLPQGRIPDWRENWWVGRYNFPL